MDDQLREWIGALGRAGWSTRRYGRLASAPALVSIDYNHGTCSDVVIFADRDEAVGYRTPSPEPDAPEYVTYLASGRLRDVVETVLSWPRPADDTVLPALMSPPPGFGVPEPLRRGNVWVRPSRWTTPAPARLRQPAAGVSPR